MSEIFGIGHSKFVSGVTTVDLDNSFVDPKFFIPQHLEHQSILTGERSYSRKVNQCEFDVTVFMSKYANPETKASEILAYLNQTVTFYPFISGSVYKNVKLISIDFYPLYKPYQKDVAILQFISYEQIAIAGWLVTKDGKYILTKDGKRIRTKGIVL